MADIDPEAVKQVAESIAANNSWSVRDWQSFVLIVLAPLGIVLALWRSWVAHKQVRIAEDGQNLDRFQKGAQMLGDKRMSVRQGGILALRELALSAVKRKKLGGQSHDVLELLAAFIHENGSQSKHGGPVVPADTEMALDAISRINEKRISMIGLDLLRSVDNGRHSVDIYNASLPGLRLHQEEFSGAGFNGGDFTYARVVNSFFNRCSMINVNLGEVEIFGSHFDHAIFHNVHLTNAHFYSCEFNDASIIGSTLKGAKFMSCKFNNVDFKRSDWSEATLDKKSLSEEQIKTLEDAGATLK
ncbi:MAG: pentapeptide repeat-containing protein [Rhizobiaceae bacterium]